MTEPEEEMSLPPVQLRAHQWVVYLLLLCFVVIGAGFSWIYLTEYERSISSREHHWNRAYLDLFENPGNPDRWFCAYLKGKLQEFYADNKRYPSNDEGFSFLSAYNGKWLFDLAREKIPFKYSSGYRLVINGPMAGLWISEDDRYSQSPYAVTYIYVNKRDKPTAPMNDLKEYEAEKLSPINIVDYGIFLYSPDLVNAVRYNDIITEQASWMPIVSILIYVVPVAGLIIALVLWRIVWVQFSFPDFRKEKKQLTFAALFTSISAVLGPIIINSGTTCYAPGPIHPIRHVLYNIYEAETIDNLLNKFQERGIIQKDTADKIRQSGGATPNR